jgi:hypothetical protein
MIVYVIFHLCRFLAANDSDADTLRMADVLVVLDFTVSAWQRQQQAETKQRKLNGFFFWQKVGETLWSYLFSWG